EACLVVLAGAEAVGILRVVEAVAVVIHAVATCVHVALTGGDEADCGSGVGIDDDSHIGDADVAGQIRRSAAAAAAAATTVAIVVRVAVAAGSAASDEDHCCNRQNGTHG